ncbi:MAG TPA: histidine kinase [Geomonas sp.]|nr:histidine kinase [Geomonas sp.]
MLAIYLDPSEPSRYAQRTYGILAGYFLYSLILGKATWRKTSVGGHIQFLTHGIDLAIFAGLMFLTSGPNSPFFVYFIFLLVCATLRWQWYGTLWTALAALVIVTALACYPVNLLHDGSFELNRFIIRLVYLAVVATLLGYLGAYEESMRKVLSLLAEWPPCAPDSLQPLLTQMLSRATAVIDAPRLVLLWEEDDEPWLHVAFCSGQELAYSSEPPDLFGTIVAVELQGTSFICENASQQGASVILHSPQGVLKCQGTPLQRLLRERFAIGAVLCSRLQGERVSGYLLALDKGVMTSDDLVLGEIVAHEVATSLDHYLLMKQLKVTAVSEERIRLARDLHDGLLQSLTGAALQLETAQRLMEAEPQTARQRIQEIQRLLAAEQRDLRSQITDLRPLLPDRPQEDFQLVPRMEQLAEQIRGHWHLAVEIATFPERPRLSRTVAREIYLVVHEALFNAVRHSGASALRAELSFAASQVQVVVADNGHGFPFRGRYDQRALSEMKRGPFTLKERIAALGGALSIDSQANGARLEITLPINE